MEENSISPQHNSGAAAAAVTVVLLAVAVAAALAGFLAYRRRSRSHRCNRSRSRQTAAQTHPAGLKASSKSCKDTKTAASLSAVVPQEQTCTCTGTVTPWLSTAPQAALLPIAFSQIAQSTNMSLWTKRFLKTRVSSLQLDNNSVQVGDREAFPPDLVDLLPFFPPLNWF